MNFSILSRSVFRASPHLPMPSAIELISSWRLNGFGKFGAIGGIDLGAPTYSMIGETCLEITFLDLRLVMWRTEFRNSHNSSDEMP